jgi:hypothetical protein
MSDTDTPVVVLDQAQQYRDLRARVERAVRPLATSVDGREFRFQASLHDLALRRGGYVVLEHESGDRFGQITDITSQVDTLDVETSPGTRSAVLVHRAVGHGLLLDPGDPVHDAIVRPATPAEVGRWMDGIRRRDRSTLVVGELLMAPGVPAELDSGGFNRHTFMCGQSGSGKTYSLGLLLERLLVETSLRVVVLDPNSDYVGLGRVRDDADPAAAARYAGVRDEVAVWSRESGADHDLRLRFTELDTRTQAALLGLDPIADRGEYAALADLLRASADGRPLVSGLDELIGSADPDARRLGMRAVNLGVLDWSIWAPRGRSLLEEVREPTSRCVVVDLGSLETPEEQRVVADAVLGCLWDTRRARQPVLVVVDEAHNVCAAEPTDPVGLITTERAVQIAAEGRKYGLYLLVSTQRPNKVHENVVLQCDNLLLMRMNSTADVADLTRSFSFVPEGLLYGAPSFGLGQALVAGRISPSGCAYVQMGERVSEQGGADVPTLWASSRTP